MVEKILKLIGSLALSFGASAIGSLATIPSIPTWYAALEKPAFNPPNWVFGPVWTVLYALMAVGLWLVWTARGDMSKERAYVAFGVQLLLNTSWSLVFFGAQQLWVGVVIIAALWAAILWMAYEFSRISRLAALLQIPYILWVAFAMVLNISLALLN